MGAAVLRPYECSWLTCCSLLIGAVAGDAAGFGVAGGPIFGREGDAPEARARFDELEADFGFAAPHGAEEDYVAFLFFFGALVYEEKLTTAGYARFHRDQSAVGVDGESLRFFFDSSALSIIAVNAHAERHQHALTAALGCAAFRGMRTVLRGHPILSQDTAREEIVEEERGAAHSKRLRPCVIHYIATINNIVQVRCSMGR